MNLRVIESNNVVGKRVLCRFDFNVPLSEADQSGTRVVIDPNKIDQSLETIHLLINGGAKEVVLMSHLGQPSGVDSSLTLKPIAHYLASKLNQSVQFNVQQMTKGDFESYRVAENIYLLENVRFNVGEETADATLAKRYASLGDIFVFDAFASAHRNHASTVGVLDILPSFAGLLLAKEVKYLSSFRDAAKHPFLMIIGGAKIVDKLPIINALMSKVDIFLVGGAVANTFLKAHGVDVKQSLVDDQNIEIAREIIEKLGDRLVLPVDYIWNNDAIADIGPKTIMLFEDRLTDAETVLWNGNLGKTEDRQFSRGSLLIADFLARLTEKTRVIAGGDTASFVNEHHLTDSMTFVSTGGGATLDFLAGKSLSVINKLEVQ